MGVGSKGLHRESVGQAWNRGSTELHWSYAWMEGVRRIQAGQGPRPTGQCTSAIFTNTQTCVEVVTGPQRYTHHNTRPFAHGHSSVYTSSQPPRTRHADNTRPRGLSAWSQMCAHKHYPGTRRHSGWDPRPCTHRNRLGYTPQVTQTHTYGKTDTCIHAEQNWTRRRMHMPDTHTL